MHMHREGGGFRVVPLPPTKSTFPQCLEASNANKTIPKTQTSVHTRKYPPARLLSVHGRPPSHLCLPSYGKMPGNAAPYRRVTLGDPVPCGPAL